MSETKEFEDEGSLFQTLMTAAYKEYPKNSTWEDFVEELSGEQRIAVVLGKLNQQVCNGGFGQWHDNRFSPSYHDALAYLKVVGTPAALACVKILKSIDMNAMHELDSMFDRGYGYQNDQDEEELMEERETMEESVSNKLHSADNEFYKINNQLLFDCEAFFRARHES